MKRYTYAEWLAEGERRFGPGQLKWRFVCPACGHAQCPEDFRPYKSQGVTADTARFNCIGRYAGVRREALGAGEGPCNYTSGGLLDLRQVTVVMEDGKEIRTFDFAESTAAQTEEAAR